MRLIDADALWTDIMMLPHNGDMISSEEVEQAIKDAPTVEVVRCKECELHEPFTFFGIEAHWCKRNEKLVAEDDFCSCGYRRDDG